ncbi:hypothetical protein HDIA_3168 [Hartmannibacter diazotrophicus]|uniref:Uncharacterized protein n=1 Tax=Hartmannibacter diazotrophicus TaxID=1482074 RepID=A0A2C9D945_9HYPH|nr:hypothetical protein [Hartmannibacter diazotrophicus]SON56709.1 hypothetical protein HDIA_3168 [Hartmannibacter diazotrophicus]
MSERIEEIGIIPFGIESWSASDLRVNERMSARLTVSAPFPVAAFERGRAATIRLNSAMLGLPAPNLIDTEKTIRERLAEYLTRLAGPWNPIGGQFLGRYLAFLDTEVDRHRGEISDRLAPFGGLYDPRDVLYSAPAPLPRAFVHAPAPDTRSEPGAIRPEDFVKVDFAFLVGGKTIAALGLPSRLTPGTLRRLQERLSAAGVTTVSFAAKDLGSEDGAVFRELLGHEGLRFWKDETLPIAPGRPELHF